MGLFVFLRGLVGVFWVGVLELSLVGFVGFWVGVVWVVFMLEYVLRMGGGFYKDDQIRCIKLVN